MSVELLLTELHRLGVSLKRSEDGNLSVSAPKGKLSEALVARIRGSKEELLRLLGGAPGGGAGGDPLPAVAPDPARLHEPFPTADLQTAFLMGERAEMEHHVRPHYYVETDHPQLDPLRYQEALNRTLARQAANLPVVNEDLQLVVPRDPAPVAVAVHDLRGLGAAEAELALAELRERMSRTTLPLDRWPWLECAVSLLPGGRARLHYNNNNFFSDGYGTTRLLADTLRCYRDPAAPLPPLRLSFRDAVLAIARIEDSARGQASRRYWHDRLPDLPPSLALPLRAGFQPRSRSRLVRRDGHLPAPVWSELKRRARAHGLTPTNAVGAVYAELVSRWSGSRHFLLNNMVTHRFPFHPEIKEIVGNFASLYPLEVDWRADAPFHERARQLQDRLVSDLQHVYVSGVSVLQALNRAQRAPGRATCPFVFGSGLFMGPMDRPVFSRLETPQVLLDHQFWETGDGSFWPVWDLIEDAFPAGMVDAMWGAYLELLTRFGGDDAIWSSRRCDLLPEEQRARRRRLNATATSLPVGLLHQPPPSAAAAPDRPAVTAGGVTLDYGQLQARVRQLAGRLGRAGACAGERVLVILDKGIDQVVAVHAVLAAGAAYVPVEPSWPADRIAYVAGSVAAPLALTSRPIREAGGLPLGLATLCVDEGSDEAIDERAAEGAAAAPRDPEELAYVIFTSGSTGRPKGVAVSHAAARNTVLDINARYGVGAADRIFGISALSFDLSVFDIFGAAAAGAALVLPAGPEVADPQGWLRLLREGAVTVWSSAPALMQLLADAALQAGAALPELRLVMLSGDWIPVTLPDQIRRFAPRARVVSLGGATEAAIWSIHYPIEQVDPAWASIPYGKPLANQTWRVLDERGCDAPDWVPGQLFIGGRGLAMGYWGEPEKTAAAFVTHGDTGERLYRTGDLGRYLPDGDIEFLGRSDFQVKIQGYRIELGEVEQVLLSHPAVGAAVVVAQGGAAGRQLAAFVVPRTGAPPGEPSADGLLAHLRAKLPSYMLPATLDLLERLPLTANGKLDRDALRAAAREGSGRPRPAQVPPRSEMERELVAIWEEVLGARPVGIFDDFFELGGQSFAALRVMTRIARRWGRHLPLGALLEGRTVASLAERIEQGQSASPLVALKTGGEGRPIFLVHPAGGGVLCYRRLAEALPRPAYGLEAAGLRGPGEPADTVEGMAASYLRALREVQPHGPYLLAGWSSGGLIAFEMAHQLERAGERAERVILLDTPAPMQHLVPSESELLHWFVEDLDLGVTAAQAAAALPAAETPPPASPQEALARLLTALAGQAPAAAALDPQQLAPVFAVFRAVVAASRRYRAARVAAELLVLRARESRVSEFHAHPADAAADWGWSGFTSGHIEAERVPGTHYTLLAPANLPALLPLLGLS